ncbi:MAG TPA: hypothetical protein VMT20_10320 [Terriglobia bacterium]|nr:hypothetical protein [Terriglobia bacterium]
MNEIDSKLKHAALERVLQSGTFATAESMRQILRFIAEHSIEQRDQEIKEYAIATEALGRARDFDPKADNIVRAQMRRVRQKLDEYYRREGAADPLRLAIPRGHYHVEFRAQGGASAPADGKSVRREDTISASRARLAGPLVWKLAAGVLLALNVGLGVMLYLRRSTSSAKSVDPKISLGPALNQIWRPFLEAREEPLIVYSNALFLMSEQGDLYRYFLNGVHTLPFGARVQSLAGLERRAPAPPLKGPLSYSDAYTGTGEVVAAAKLAELFARCGRNFSVERDGIVSFEDIRNTNVVFLGANLEDPVLAQLPTVNDLEFEEDARHAFSGSQIIRDRHPPAGRPSTYELQRDSKTQAIEGDYALVSLLPGVTPNHSILVLGGISTLGTQAAAEFATSEDNMRAVAQMRAEGLGRKPASPYFQALLAVQIRDGVAAKTDCTLVREVRHN